MDSSTQPHYYPGANLARPSRLRKAQKNQCRYLMTDAGNPAAPDPKSLPHLQGLTVDWVDTLEEQGFKLINPNAVSQCGCGQSFQT